MSVPWIASDQTAPAQRWWYGGGETIRQFRWTGAALVLITAPPSWLDVGGVVRGASVKGWWDGSAVQPMRMG